MLKTRFPFLYASPIPDAKTFVYKTFASNLNFEAVCRFFVLLLSTFAVFPFLSRVFSLPLATLLINFSSSLTLHLAIEIKKRVCNGFLFPGNLGAQSVTLRSPVVLLVCGSRGRDNLLAWGKLFANPYELKSHTRVWEEYNHFERFYRVCRLDRFFSNFAKTSQE